ncbi:hypothetical protein LTS08_001516 [Lithohypha guttulata]|uniref:uncharacterized protein n=1 Tax=Lithohypha guttulata TaxID=1690604 RepID=UPI002DDFD6A1|nr:hypothetical protein LTR51_003818 [Lithohypha guttulata]KAK5105241.1 hypothetical protein LTS08_001516 [Lithohypha guttulata]
MAQIRPYTIDIPQAKLDRLKRNLCDYQWPTELQDDPAWDYGTPEKDIKHFYQHWKDKFDWRDHEKKLNELPNFETTVDIDGHGGVDVHFLHFKNDAPNAIPLLFVHGWPGSVLECVRLAPLLKGGDGKPAFEVVAPSLPNYTFSGPALKRGFGIPKYAEACHKVMLALGFNQYVVQGGDWGFLICRTLSAKYPQHVKGIHTNWAWASEPKWTDENPKPASYSERELNQMKQGERWNPFGTGEGRGYIAIQSTRPATINYMISDSPVGLLAWIWDKLVDWSDRYPWTEDEVCLWVSLYVFSRAGPDAASYIYYEATHDLETLQLVQSYIDCPLGLADFPVELCNNPKSWRHTMGPIVYQEEFDRGGHFSGYERPDAVAKGLSEMFGKDGKAHGVVSGRSGY